MEVLLSNLSDKQKALLAEISYLELDIKSYLNSKNNSLSISDLSLFLINKEEPYLGNIASSISGITTTNNELLNITIEANLGNLKIKCIEKNFKNGFLGIAFYDSYGNVGMSFKGTNVSNLGNFLQDSATDIQERITGNTSQAESALDFFKNNKTYMYGNYLFGHSLGGNLVEHVFLENFNVIKTAFVFNALPIDEELLDTAEKINAFNSPDKFECIITGGDIVSELASCEKYASNIKFVKNNGSNNNLFYNHTINVSTYDANNNFVNVSSRSKADEGFKKDSHKKFIGITNWIAEKLKRTYKRIRICYKKYYRKKHHKQKLLSESKNTSSNEVKKL